jgi:glycosyltransferase involved in cell wall biosynthesis
LPASQDHHFVLLAKPARLDFLRQIAPHFEVVEANVKEFTFAEQTTLKRQIEGLKPDLVFFPMVQQPAFYRGRVVTSMLDLTTVRFRNPAKNWLVFTVKQAVYKWLTKRVAHKSVHIITPTEFVRQDIADYCHVSTNKISTIYDSADKITAPPEPYQPLSEQNFLLYVGRPAANKNLNRLVDAFNQLQRPGLKLVFAGKTNGEYRKLAAYTDNAPDIIFTDFVSDGQLRWLYQHAQVYVFPSLSEGFGLPGLEAMLYDLPVVSSNATCLPEVYRDAALYFDPLDSADIAAKINQLLNDPTLAKDLAAKGRQVVASYSWQRTAQRTLDVFAKALKT